MSADSKLQAAYKEWRRVAETEGEAIRVRNWILAADCQKALRQLQPQIIQHTQEAQAEWTRAGLDSKERGETFRAVISDLIEIESRNNTLLTSAREAARSQLDDLENADRMLHHVKRSYAPPHSTGWTSFS